MSSFIITTARPLVFKVLFDILKDLLPETTIEIISQNDDNDKSGFKIIAVDRTKTVIINIFLKATEFYKFRCDINGCRISLKISLKTAHLHKILSHVNKGDMITFSMNKNDNKYLKINITNSYTTTDIKYSLKLLDLHSEHIVMPTIRFDALISIESKELQKICKMTQSVADCVEIKCSKDNITFDANGHTSLLITKTCDADSIYIKTDVENVIVSGLYELKNLVLFTKCTSLCNEAIIYMKNDYPIFLKYNIRYATSCLPLCDVDLLDNIP